MFQNLLGRVLLDRYRVDAFIAAGGMGVVYRVWDIKRNAPLAMKVLHADLADDPAMFHRFQREANALKKLAHPNIVPFYGLYRSSGIAFLLEAFIAGPTLKELLTRRADQLLTVLEALTYLKGLASALGYAHTNGVVHCDVKPGNVMVDPGGTIYLTDFGVARHADSTTTTLASAGTPAYMAPEQIRGEAVSPATDVYALGILSFEMLAGERPFHGQSKSSESQGSTAAERIRNAHLTQQPPDPHAFNPGLPDALAMVILKALEKEPGQRYPDTMTFFTAMCTAAQVSPEHVLARISVPDWVQAEINPTSANAVSPEQVNASATRGIPQIRKRQGIFFVLGFGALILLIGLVLTLGGRGSRERPNLESTSSFSGGNENKPTTVLVGALPVVPASATLVMQSPQPSATALTFHSTPIQPLLPTQTLIIKPTSESNQLQGKIVFLCQIGNDQLCMINADGTGFRRLTSDRNVYAFPSFAPDGQSIVYVSNKNGEFDVYEMNLASDHATQLTQGMGDINAPEVSPNGHSIVFTHKANGNEIWIMDRNGSNPQKIYGLPTGYGWDPVWSPDGQQILFAAGTVQKASPAIMYADGSNMHIIGQLDGFRGRSTWSPIGEWIATYAGPDWNHDIYLMKLGHSFKKITSGGNNLAPSFSPDGKWLTFTSYRDHMGDANGCEIYIMRLDGSDIRRLTDNDYCDWQPRWGP